LKTIIDLLISPLVGERPFKADIAYESGFGTVFSTFVFSIKAFKKGYFSM
jgi:hypothetical protein